MIGSVWLSTALTITSWGRSTISGNSELSSSSSDWLLSQSWLSLP